MHSIQYTNLSKKENYPIKNTLHWFPPRGNSSMENNLKISLSNKNYTALTAIR
jgi:hypothetical protein